MECVRCCCSGSVAFCCCIINLAPLVNVNAPADSDACCLSSDGAVGVCYSVLTTQNLHWTCDLQRLDPVWLMGVFDADCLTKSCSIAGGRLFGWFDWERWKAERSGVFFSFPAVDKVMSDQLEEVERELYKHVGCKMFHQTGDTAHSLRCCCCFCSSECDIGNVLIHRHV